MDFVPLNEANKEEPQGFSFVPLAEANKQELSFVPLDGTSAATTPTETTNPFKGALGRGATLLGQGIEGIARVAEAGGDYMEQKVPLSGLSKEEIEGKRQLEPLFKWADSLKDFGQEINYKPTQKLSDIGENPATIIPFIAERIITSSPDMAAAVAALPAYVSARTNEILNDRIKNDGKELKDVTVSDVAVSAGAAILEATLERFATKGLLKGQHITGPTGATRIGKETIFQAGTEGIEEGIGYLGGTAGTKKGVDPKELAENVVEGAIVGGGLGATVQGGKEAYSKFTDVTPTMGEVPAPPAPRAPTPEEGRIVTPAAEQFRLEAQTRYQELGFSRTEAERLANEEIKEAGYGGSGDRTVAGTSEPSVQAPNIQAPAGGVTEGVTSPELGGVGTTVGTTGLPRAGEEVQYGALNMQPMMAATNNLMAVLQGASDGFTKAQQEYAETGQSPTLKKVKSYLTKSFTPLLGAKKTKDYVNYLTEEGGLDSSDYGSNSEYFQDALAKMVPQEVVTATPTEAVPPTPETVTSTTVAEEPVPTANGVPITKGKRGRPALELTPEQAAQKAEARKGSQAATRNAIRMAEKAEKTLAQTFDPSEFESINAAQVANTEFNEARRQALEDLYSLSVAPAHRNNKAGTIAKRLLSQATPQERQIAQERVEAKKKAGIANRAEFIDATNGSDNTAYLGFKDAKQAMSWLSRTGNAFEKDMARRLAPFVKNTKLVIVNDINELPTAKLRESFDGAGGMYYKGVIYLAAQGGINNTIFLHEALHGATIDRIDQWQNAFDKGLPIDPKLDRAVLELYRTMFEAKDQFDALKEAGMLDDRMLAFEKAGAFTDVKEFVAYGMSHPTMQEFLMQTPGFYEGEKKSFISDLFNRFVQSLRTMFNMGESHKSAFQDLIIVTEQLLRAPVNEKVTTSKIALAKKSDKKIDKDMEKVRISNNAFESTNAIGNAIKNHDFQDFKDLLNAQFDALDNGFIKKVLYTMQTVDIIRWKGDEVAALKDIDTIQQEMSTMRMRMLAASAKKADQLGAFIRKNGMQTLGSTMHLARLKKVSPTANPDAATAIKNDPVIKHYEALLKVPGLEKAKMAAYKGKITLRTNDINAVYKLWDALGKQKGGHEMYEMVRQFYKDNYTAMRTILDDQLDALPIDDAAKAKLLKSVRLMQEQTKSGADEDFDNMERKALPEEYFPFKRDGKYWLRVAAGPTGREFYLFDSGVARNQFLTKRARELGKNPNDGSLFTKGDDITSLRKNFQDSSVMLQEMFATIDSTSENPKFDQSKYKDAAEAHAAMKEELKDQLYQVYLMTMPERSFRKQFLHAEEITGFSADIFRNFKTSATSYANQLAKLKYGTELENRIQSGRDSLEGMPTDKRAKLELFVNEIATRAREEINPPETGQVVSRINQFAFLWLLTSAASAATQMASVPVMVMPTLNQEYGYGQTAAKFAKYLPVWKSVGVTETAPNGEVTWVAPTIGASSMVKGNPILQRAFEAGIDRNVTGLTNVSVLTNKNRTPDNSYANAPQAAARVGFNAMTALFSGAERMSREIAYMMTFELEYAKTKDFDASVQKAIDTTHELLGRYDNFNRPRILRNAFGKTVGQFKQYAVFMTSWFTRNAYTMFSEGLMKEEGRAAMHRLAGTLIMGGMFHGLVGMPLYSTICSVIDAALDTDDEDRKRRRAKNPLTADSSNLRFRYEWLPENFGDITMPGIDGRQHRLSEILEKGPISALTDINIGSRTSLDGMWFREAKPGKTYLETAQNYILANLGPGVSTGVNMVGAIDDFTTGHIDRGLEKLVPAFFRGSLVAGRLATEGAETKGGADLLKKEEISTLNIIAAALGFNPTRLARIQEKNFEMQKQITEAQNKRTALLRQLDETAFDTEGDKADVRAVMQKINEFNKRYPADGLLIDADTIEKSLEAYGKKRGMTFRGQYISEKMLPYLIKPTKAVVPLQ